MNEQYPYYSFPFSKGQALPAKYGFAALSAVFIFLMLLGLGQDFLDASINGYSYYFSESFSFNVFWFVFIPLFGGLFYAAHWVDSRWIYAAAVVITSVLHIAIAALLVFVITLLFLDHTFYFTRVARYFLTEDLGITLTIYAVGISGLYLYKKASAPQINSRRRPAFISVSANKQMVPVAVSNIQYIATDRPYLSIHTNDDCYLYDATLKAMLGKLDPVLFVRVHRSAIVNLDYVIRCTSRSNGDYDLSMCNGDTVRMSRNYSQNYKKATL